MLKIREKLKRTSEQLTVLFNWGQYPLQYADIFLILNLPPGCKLKYSSPSFVLVGDEEVDQFRLVISWSE